MSALNKKNKLKSIWFGDKEVNAFKELKLSVPMPNFVKGLFWEKIDKIRLERGEFKKVYVPADKLKGSGSP